MTTTPRIVLTSAQRALLAAVADVIDEIGTASIAMAAERVKRRPPDVRDDAAVLLRLGLVDRLQPDVVMLGRGWLALGRMPRSRLAAPSEVPAPAEPQLALLSPDADPPAEVPAAPATATAKGAMLAYALSATRPASAREIADATGTPVPTAKVTLRTLAREGRIGRCMIDGAAHYGPLTTTPDASSAGPDPAGDAGPGVIAPPPAVDDQAREGSACGESCPASEGSGDVDEAPPGDPVEELSGGGDAAAGALASRSEYEIAIRLKTAIFAGGLGEVLGRPVEPHATKLHIYVATGLEHAHRAWLVGYALRAAGHAITYDWTTHGSVQGEGFARLAEVAQAERRGVAVADLVIAILPGGRGTHVEIGMALGYGIPVALLIQDGCYDAECAFYSLPEVDRRGWTTLTELIDGAVSAAALAAVARGEALLRGPDPYFDAAEETMLRVELEQHVAALDEIRATLVDVGVASEVTTDTGTVTHNSTPTMTNMAANELRRTRAQAGAAMLALQRIATAAGLPDGVELKARDLDELVEHITERLAADPPSGTTVRTILEAVSEASGFLLDWHADDEPMVAQLPRLVDHLRAVASKAAIVEHAERHGDSAQELVASLPAMVELLLEYDVTVDPTTAPGGPLVHAVRRALSVSQDRGIALATTDGVVGELHARCQDYAELAAELRGAATRIPSLAAAANDLEARIAVVRGAAAIVQAEVASA